MSDEAGYTIRVNETQARIMADALAFYARVVGQGRLEDVARSRERLAGRDPREGESAMMKAMRDAKPTALGLGEFREARIDEAHADCRAAFDLWRAVRRGITQRRACAMDEARWFLDAQAVRASYCWRKVEPVGDEPVAAVEAFGGAEAREPRPEPWGPRSRPVIDGTCPDGESCGGGCETSCRRVHLVPPGRGRMPYGSWPGPVRGAHGSGDPVSG